MLRLLRDIHRGNKIHNGKESPTTQKDVEYGKTGNSAIARHTKQFQHKIDRTNTECLETEKRLFPRKIIESAYIKANRNRCMNLNEGLGVTTIYGKGKEGKRKFT